MQAFLVDGLRLSIWLILLAVIFVPLERVFAVRPSPIIRHQSGVDLAWYFINALVPAAIMAVPLAMLVSALHGFDPVGFYSWVAGLPYWIKLVAALVINDLAAYWMHRYMHSNPFLWRIHAIHHSAGHVDWLVNSRAHPLDIVILHMAGLVPVYLLGLASASNGADPVAVTVVLVGTFWSFMIHANIKWRLGFVEHMISSPAFHHWHHTNDEFRDHNFAAILPVLDRLFGTLHLPPEFPTVYGVDADVPPEIIGQLLHPIRA